MSRQTVIRGGLVVTEESVVEQDLIVTDGRIDRLAERNDPVPGATVLSAEGQYVLPGGIDPHTHVWWPFDGHRAADGWEGATAAAVVSGTTTIVDFVPVPRGQSALACAEGRMREAEGAAFVDYSFHPILTSSAPALVREIPELVGMGLASFKMYTTYEDQRVDDGDVWILMNAIATANGLPGFHAENHEIIRRLTKDLVATGRTTMRDFSVSRPPIAEAEAAAMVVQFARELDCPVYLFHLSDASAIQVLAEGQRRGVLAAGETCTHYLTFDDSVFDEEDAWKYLITPPIRSTANRPLLWEALQRGVLTGVGSDHCAYRADDKTSSDDFTTVPAGAPGIDARVPVLWSLGVGGGRLSPVEFSQANSTRPAKALGLYPRKGTIRPGSDADLILLDPGADGVFTESPRCTDYSLYAGMPLRGRVAATLVRGVTVARDSRLAGESGPGGQFIPRRIDRGLLAEAISGGEG